MIFHRHSFSLKSFKPNRSSDFEFRLFEPKRRRKEARRLRLTHRRQTLRLPSQEPADIPHAQHFPSHTMSACQNGQNASCPSDTDDDCPRVQHQEQTRCKEPIQRSRRAERPHMPTCQSSQGSKSRANRKQSRTAYNQLNSSVISTTSFKVLCTGQVFAARSIFFLSSSL